MTAIVDFPKTDSSHASLLSILDGLDAIVYVTDMQTNRIIYANRYLTDVLGEMTGKICWQALQENQDGPCRFCTNKYLLDEHGKPKGVHAWEFQNTRNQRWYAIRDRAVRWVDGRIVRLEIAVDITDRKNGDKELRKALQREKELAQVTLGSIGDAVIRTDCQGRIGYLNPSAERMLEISVADAIGKPLDTVLRWPRSPDVDEPMALVAKVSSQGQRIDLPDPVVLLTGDDARRAVEISATPFRVDDAGDYGVVLVLRDVSQTRRLAIQLSHQAAHDPLTGLINRREFDRRLADLCASAAGRDGSHALLFIDLDRFKVVNDTCGHGAGDELLRQLSSLLQTRMRQTDTLARLGGDEFGVLLPGCALADAVNIAGDLQRAIDSYRFAWDGRQFAVGSSIGVMPFDGTTAAPGELLSSADRACYAAKARGGNRVYVYHQNDASLAKHSGEVRWVARLPDALDAGRFQLYAQAIVPLSGDSATPHYEILVRMVQDDGSLVLPGAFIPAAERFGLMPRVDRWVVEQALTFHASLGAPTEVPLFFINLSGTSLSSEHFVEFLTQRVAAHGPYARRLCFEITETAAISNLAHVAEVIDTLSAFGCSFALDDFGAGMSSFPYLKSLPVAFLKIEGSFIRAIEPQSMDHALVDAINRVAHHVGLITIAEHVEDREKLELLRSLGIDYAQGYSLGRPQLLSETSVQRAPLVSAQGMV